MDIKVHQSHTTSYTSCESIIVVSDQYLAISHGSTITVYCLDVTKREILLKGHKDTVSQLHFIASNIIISSSYNSLLSWNLDDARTATNLGEKIPHIFIGVGLGKANYIATSDHMILLALKNDVAVLDTKEGNTTFLEGHDSAVMFCGMTNKGQIVSMSLDNSMKVWSLTERCVLAQFSLLSSSPLFSFYLDPETSLLYLGSCDGQLYVYRPHCGSRVKRLNVESMIDNESSEESSPVCDNVISANRSYHVTDGQVSNGENCSEIQNTVINIVKSTIKNISQPVDFQNTFDGVQPISKGVHNVLVVTLTSGIVQLNLASLQLLSSTNFYHISPELPLAYVASSFTSDMTHIAYMDMTASTITVLSLRLIIESGSGVSMIQQGLLNPSSPLLCETQWKKSIGPTKPKKSEKKTKIKSSGYSATQSRREMFKPISSTATLKKSKDPSKKELYEYPSGPCMPIHKKRVLKTSSVKTAINCLYYSRNAQYIGTGLSDGSALVMKLPDGAKTYPLIGHKGAVTCLKWSTEDNLITTSADRTAKVWSVGSTEPLIDLKYTDGDTKSCKKIEFVKDIVGAQFYYLDKFLLLASGPSLYLYKYYLEKNKCDIQRYIELSRYQLVCSDEVKSGHTISAICSSNAHFSNIVVTATADKSVHLFDYNTQRIGMTIKDAHDRAVHSVQVVEGSRYVTHTADTYNIILSTAASDHTKLWDTRSGVCVYSCNQHTSATIRSHAGISTCARYVAATADDMSVYIYDVRGTSGPVKLITSDHSLSAQFSPKYPQLAVSCVDGSVTFYNNTS